MNKKEFYEKFVYEVCNGDEYDGDYLIDDADEVWQWIEEQIKQAKTDENNWWIKRYAKKGGIQDDAEAIYFHKRRIKELNK